MARRTMEQGRPSRSRVRSHGKTVTTRVSTAGGDSHPSPRAAVRFAQDPRGRAAVSSAARTPSRPGCAGYGSETAWSNSGGGVSQVFGRPAFQAGCGVPLGSQRLVPDVALEADPSPGNYVLFGGQWYWVGGTSEAAPQWAGF